MAELEQANTQLRQMSNTDSLTGLYNRRFLDEALHREWARMERDSGELGLILLDVDHFKLYNDKLGHPAGDECLRQLARALSMSVNRPADVVARFGGEEFAVLLPETGEAGGLQVAHRIRTTLQGLALDYPASDVAAIVTVSMGVCSARPARGSSPGPLVEHADQALYRAKSNGRDRIEVAEPLPDPQPSQDGAPRAG